MTFMADYAAYLVNRLEVGTDGKTGYERSRGKKAKVLGVELGEKLMWERKPKDRGAVCQFNGFSKARVLGSAEWGLHYNLELQKRSNNRAPSTGVQHLPDRKI